MCQQAEEEGRYRVLSAYETTEFEEAVSAVPIEEKSSKEISELKAEIDGLKAKNEKWRQELGEGRNIAEGLGERDSSFM